MAIPLPQQLIIVLDYLPMFVVQILFILIFPCGITIILLKQKCFGPHEPQNDDVISVKWHKLARTILPRLKKGASETDTILFDYKVPPSFISSLVFSTSHITFSSMAIFWQELFIQGYLYQPGLDSELYCYENLWETWNVNCSDIDCTNMLCYKFDLDFGKAFTNAAGLFTFFIFSFSATTVFLIFASGGKNGSKKRKCLTIFLCILIFAVYAFFYISLLAMDVIFLLNNLNRHSFRYFLNGNYITTLTSTLLFAVRVKWWEFEEIPQDQMEPNAHDQMALEEPNDQRGRSTVNMTFNTAVFYVVINMNPTVHSSRAIMNDLV